MSDQLQSVLAIAIVLLTAVIFVYSSFVKKKSACGDCDCPAKSSKIHPSKKQ